jgi:hypothetical protein
LLIAVCETDGERETSTNAGYCCDCLLTDRF